jgi:hypothetical protein
MTTRDRVLVVRDAFALFAIVALGLFIAGQP